MPSVTNFSQMTNDRILVDDLPYIDQEYGDPSLREVVSNAIILVSLLECYFKTFMTNNKKLYFYAKCPNLNRYYYI